MSDQSELDRKYFIDGDKYNCPYCNRHSVVYGIYSNFSFDWTDKKKAYGFIVQCHGCSRKSLHLSFTPLNDDNFTSSYQAKDKNGKYQYYKPNPAMLDSFFFYHHPTSFFTLDKRIPPIVRKLVAEADDCRKMNKLVGASGALRKGIYKFLKDKNAHEQTDEKGKSLSYKKQIKWLKSQHPLVAGEYFDALGQIQGMTSEELHEDKDWEPWTREDFDFLVATVKAVLHEVYVVPEVRKGMLGRVLALGPEKKAAMKKGIKDSKKK